jgi:general secretion pathway protein D
MAVFSREGWLSGLLMLLLAGCSMFLPAKPPPRIPPPAVKPALGPAPEAPKPPAPEPAQPAAPSVAEAQPAPPPTPPAAPAPQVTPAPPTPAPPAPARPPGRLVVFNFDNADIEVVIHAASEVLGFNYVLEPEVKGKKVTVQTSGRIAQEDVFKVLLAILEVHGVTAIKSENLYKIVRLEGARERPVPTIVGADPDPSRVGDEVITQIVPLKFASAAELSGLLRPLISARGNLVTHRETNLLVVTDAASNVRRILEIVKLVDVAVTLEELQVIPLKFADAQELANVLNQLFAPGRVRPSAPVQTLPAPPAPPAAARPLEAPTPERPPMIVAYRGINVMIVQARKPEMDAIRRHIAQLDVDNYGGRRVLNYIAENTKPKDLTATMSAIYGRAEAAPPARPTPAPPGAPPPPSPPPPARPAGVPGGPEAGLVEGEVRFIADEVTNAVIVTTFPRNWPEIEGTLKKLDRMPRQVLIEVLVAEVTLDDQTSLGIEWAARQGRFDIFQAPSGTFAGRPTFRVPPLPVTGLGQGLTFFTFQTGQFFTLLNALASEDKVNVLSSPSIMTTENKKAVINVSTSVPVVTSQQVPIAAGGTGITATQTVEFKDAGVILTVTPRIGEKGTVALDIKQEVNDVGPEETTLKIRSFTKREAETSVVLLNNQTLVMGGLIKNSRDV